jgi:hypothetical protein
MPAESSSALRLISTIARPLPMFISTISLLWDAIPGLIGFCRWLDAAVALLQGSFEQKLHLDNGTVELKRIGRGGALVSIKTANDKAIFDLADFILALRGAAKDFLPFVGRCIVTLKNGVKSFQQEADAELYIERERAIASVLKHQSLDRCTAALF